MLFSGECEYHGRLAPVFWRLSWLLFCPPLKTTTTSILCFEIATQDAGGHHDLRTNLEWPNKTSHTGLLNLNPVISFWVVFLDWKLGPGAKYKMGWEIQLSNIEWETQCDIYAFTVFQDTNDTMLIIFYRVSKKWAVPGKIISFLQVS